MSTDCSGHSYAELSTAKVLAAAAECIMAIEARRTRELNKVLDEYIAEQARGICGIWKRTLTREQARAEMQDGGIDSAMRVHMPTVACEEQYDRALRLRCLALATASETMFVTALDFSAIDNWHKVGD